MAIKGHCGGDCGECGGCKLDEMIPCNPNCENLTQDGIYGASAKKSNIYLTWKIARMMKLLKDTEK